MLGLNDDVVNSGNGNNDDGYKIRVVMSIILTLIAMLKLLTEITTKTRTIITTLRWILIEILWRYEH